MVSGNYKGIIDDIGIPAFLKIIGRVVSNKKVLDPVEGIEYIFCKKIASDCYEFNVKNYKDDDDEVEYAYRCIRININKEGIVEFAYYARLDYLMSSKRIKEIVNTTIYEIPREYGLFKINGALNKQNI